MKTALGEDVADLQRRPVAHQPVARVGRRVPCGRGSRTIRRSSGGCRCRRGAGRRSAAPTSGSRCRRRRGGSRGRRRRRSRGPRARAGRQRPQQGAVETAAPGPGDHRQRADQQESPSLADRRVGVVGPEGDEGGGAGGGQPDPQQDRQVADAAPHREEGRGDARQPDQRQVNDQHPEGFPIRFHRTIRASLAARRTRYGRLLAPRSSREPYRGAG